MSRSVARSAGSMRIPGPRTAGPPTPLGEMFVWTCVSVICYICFVLIPGKLNRAKYSPVLGKAYQDINFVASHLHFCIWSWAVFDLSWRFFCMILLPFEQLQKMSIVFSNYTADGFSGASVNSMRSLIGVAPLGAGRGSVASPSGTMNENRVFNHNDVVVCSAISVLLLLMWCTWWFHCRHVLRTRKRRYAKRIAATANDKEGSANSDSQQQQEASEALTQMAESPFIPTVTWMVLWCIAYASFYAYRKAVPILTSILYPIGVIVVLLFCIFIP